MTTVATKKCACGAWTIYKDARCKTCRVVGTVNYAGDAAASRQTLREQAAACDHNPYAEKGRAAKVQDAVSAIEGRLGGAQYGPDAEAIALRLVGADDEEWAQFSEAVGINQPSAATRQEIVAVFERRSGEQAPKLPEDAFAGLPAA